MPTFHPSRREFLARSSLAAGAALLSSWPTEGQAQPPAPLVRKNIKALDPNGPEITKLRNAFRVLEARTQTNPQDPTGWLAQANIHRNRCTHANWWFFPWHRAYLYYFEQILRAAAGDPTLTLPYWDWSDPATRAIPAPFWTQYLYRVYRGPGIGPSSQVPDEYVDPDTVIAPILNITDFATFGGAAATAPLQQAGAGWLEGSPHNNVHSWVGGAMGIVAWAAQDPIFWLHHANVDRLWAVWAAQHPNAYPTSSTWLNQPFQFVAVNGQAVTIRPSQVLTTTALNYRYDTQPAADPVLVAASEGAAPRARGTRARVEAAAPRAAIAATPVTVTVAPTQAFHPHVSGVLNAVAASAPRPGTIQLAIEGIQVPSRPDVLVRVFLNKPDADASTSFKDPHYAGNFSFFTHDGAHPAAGQPHAAAATTTQFLDVTRTLQRLQAMGEYKPTDPLKVTLLAVPIAEGRQPATQLPFQKVSLTVIP
jgi:hypothetical protein